MARPGIETGPTTKALVALVEELRRRDGLSYEELSNRLEKAGRRIPELGLRKMKAGERRVDVDELVALAQVFGVPTWVLLGVEAPAGYDDDFGTRDVEAHDAWRRASEMWRQVADAQEKLAADQKRAEGLVAEAQRIFERVRAIEQKLQPEDEG